jgi:hypothetical protein
MTEERVEYKTRQQMSEAVDRSAMTMVLAEVQRLRGLVAELAAPYDAGIYHTDGGYTCLYCGAHQNWFTVGARFPHAEDCAVTRGREL